MSSPCHSPGGPAADPGESDLVRARRAGRNAGASPREWRLRLAAANDVTALAALIQAAYVVEAELVRGKRIDEAGVADYQRRGTFLLAEQVEARPHAPRAGESSASSLAGCVFVEPRGRSGYLGLLSVEPALQGAGLGEALLEAAEAHLGESGCAEVEILVVSERAELFPWYEKRGYRRTGTRPFSDPAKLLRLCHFVEMRKPLGPPRRSP